RRVLAHPAVADKTFLISIGDRTVTGLVARDQMVGPWQVPVADCAVTAAAYDVYTGEAMALGERTPVAVNDAAASARLAVGEALTNLAAACIADLGHVNLSANWMAAPALPGDAADLYAAVHAIGMELCPALGITIPVGKDSMSMSTGWTEADPVTGNQRQKRVTAPVSLIITAFAPVADIRRTLTPQLRTDAEAGGETELLLVDLGRGRNRLGGSILAQTFSLTGDTPPDVDAPADLRAFWNAIQALNAGEKLLAYPARSDGGLFATISEMAFAGHTGVDGELPPAPSPPPPPGSADIRPVDVASPQSGAGVPPASGGVARASCPCDDAQRRLLPCPLAQLFSEEPGAVLQTRVADRDAIHAILRAHRLDDATSRIGKPNTTKTLRIRAADGDELFAEDLFTLRAIWSDTTRRIAALRDNPDCAESEYRLKLDPTDPGLTPKVTFDLSPPAVAAPAVLLKARPPIAILREQGVNGQTEMAAAFTRAGFRAVDVHMTDVLTGRIRLRDFRGLAACGGFSYGDVLGAGEGWAKSILFNPRAREEFATCLARPDFFALGVCNGCQMMSNLHEIVPGAAAWPRFVQNKSGRFEARVASLLIEKSPSILFAGMEGSVLPIAVAHGEGLAEFPTPAAADRFNDSGLVSARYVDNLHRATGLYPLNPNGSPHGITAITTLDGRVTILMPHPERVFRTTQHSWHPKSWLAHDDSPWMRLFRNARAWVG
ncbi:MAG: phosphoribosylformylglycinamidine synthase, partial [Opitutaceae bacterium]|nr:phosphoribosylformylglycinamidine synthase [Opitutaceae bacterium]